METTKPGKKSSKKRRGGPEWYRESKGLLYKPLKENNLYKAIERGQCEWQSTGITNNGNKRYIRKDEGIQGRGIGKGDSP